MPLRLPLALFLALVMGACNKSEPEPMGGPDRNRADREQGIDPEDPAPDADIDDGAADPADTQDGRRTAPRGTAPRTGGSPADEPAPTGPDDDEPADPAAPDPGTGEEPGDEDGTEAPYKADPGGDSGLRPPPKGLEILPNNRWRIPRYLADRWEEHPYRVARPVQVDDGWKMRRCKPGSQGWWLGLRNGDVVTRVNGMKLNNKAQLLAAYVKLKNKTDFEVTIRRGGSTRVHHYRIVD